MPCLGGPPSQPQPQPETLHVNSGLPRMRMVCRIAGPGSVLSAAVAVFGVSVPMTGDLGAAVITERSDTRPREASSLPQTRSSVQTPRSPDPPRLPGTPCGPFFNPSVYVFLSTRQNAHKKGDSWIGSVCLPKGLFAFSRSPPLTQSDFSSRFKSSRGDAHLLKTRPGSKTDP